jgi:hypothetical protein
MTARVSASDAERLQLCQLCGGCRRERPWRKQTLAQCDNRGSFAKHVSLLLLLGSRAPLSPRSQFFRASSNGMFDEPRRWMIY